MGAIAASPTRPWLELTQLKTGELRKRAKAVGVGMERVEEAIDEDDKAAAVSLILAAMAAGGGLPEGVPSRAAVPEPEPEPLEPEVEPEVALERTVSNPPGTWDAMISYTQRHAVSEALAYKVHASFARRGKTAWLDVEMAKRDEAAIKEAVETSRCIIAIISGDDPSDENAYFNRAFCVKELRWAQQRTRIRLAA